MLHTPQAGKTNRIRTKRPLYQDGGAHCAAQENLGRFDQPSTLRAPLLDWLAWSDLLSAINMFEVLICTLVEGRRARV